MPYSMAGCTRLAVMQGKVYVGGGITDKESDGRIVMEYTSSSGKWAMLPPYRRRCFTMAVIHNQLLLVGGYERHQPASKVLGVWGADRKAWMHPYPDMHTGRCRCSAAVHFEWLVVAGGYGRRKNNLSSVEVLNTDTKQWYAGPPMPMPSWKMKTAVVGDMYYSMGGCGGDDEPIKTVLSASMQALIRHVNSCKEEPEDQIWKEIPGPQLMGSAPLSISGSLLAVGGDDENEEDKTAIHFYQPKTGEWVKAGDMPTPRSNCVCTRISDREVLVAGGWYKKRLSTVLVGTFNI